MLLSQLPALDLLISLSTKLKSFLLSNFCSLCSYWQRLRSNHTLPISFLNSADWLLQASRCPPSSPGPYPSATHGLAQSLCVVPLPHVVHVPHAHPLQLSRRFPQQPDPCRVGPPPPSPNPHPCGHRGCRLSPAPRWRPCTHLPPSAAASLHGGPAASQFLPRCHTGVKANAIQTAGVSILSSSTAFVISLKKIQSYLLVLFSIPASWLTLIRIHSN